jgi:putative hydrolase of the HAD superfamily
MAKNATTPYLFFLMPHIPKGKKMQIEQPQAIQTVFFDVGFTLIHPYPSDLDICQQACARLGLDIHPDGIKKRLPDAQDFYLQHMRNNSSIWANETEIRTFWTTYYIHLLRPFVKDNDEEWLHQLAETIICEYESPANWQIYPDVIPTLETLQASQKYRLGAISDWGISLGAILQHLRLNSYFDCLLISATTRHAKPSPRLYETALERANSIADYTIHVGDSYTLDVLGARGVGMTPVLLDRKHHLQQRQVDCLLIHSLCEIPQLLEIE